MCVYVHILSAYRPKGTFFFEKSFVPFLCWLLSVSSWDVDIRHSSVSGEHKQGSTPGQNVPTRISVVARCSLGDVFAPACPIRPNRVETEMRGHFCLVRRTHPMRIAVPKRDGQDIKTWKQGPRGKRQQQTMCQRNKKVSLW